MNQLDNETSTDNENAHFSSNDTTTPVIVEGFNNVTEQVHQHEILLNWIIRIYFTFIIVGVCINLFLIVNIIQRKKNGTLYLVLQIAAVDVARSWIAVCEICYLENNSWNFGSVLCPLYFGSEVVLDTLSVYLLVLLNFHTISTWNIQKELVANDKNPLTQVTDNSTECLVNVDASQTQPSRSIYIDYRRNKFSLSIIIPCILIWFCCLSLSIPKFSLTTTIDNYNNHTVLCTMVDFHYGYLIRYLLIVFRNVVPIPLLLLTFVSNLVLVCKGSLNVIKKNSLPKYEQINRLFLLSFQLTLSFVFFSLQRSVFYVLHNLYPYHNTIEDNFKFAPLENRILSQYMNLYSCMLHYATIGIRPILCILSLPFILDKIKAIVFCKSKTENK